MTALRLSYYSHPGSGQYDSLHLNMRKFFFSIVLAFLIFNCNVVLSQQQYLSSDYGGPGTIYLYNRMTGNLPTQEVTASGTAVTWDLSAFAGLNTHVTQIVTPSQGIDQINYLTICALSGISFLECFTIWSQTDQALLSKDSLSLFGFTLVDLQRFQNKTSNLLLENFFGFTVDFGGSPTPAVIVYQNPDTIFHFPITYSDSWSSVIDWSLDLSAAGLPVRYSSRQTRTTEVDAWGTLLTPYDTFTNVVRTRSEILHQDTLYTDTLDVPVNITQVEYMWFDTSYKLPVMVANGIIVDTVEILSVVEYIYEATCPVAAWSVDTGSDIFYIDSTGSVTINFDITGSNANIYEWDFGDGTTATSDGNISHTYFIAGEYPVAVTGCMTNCLPLNSCSSQIIDFEIIDTVSSIQIAQSANLGIKLYPNPVTDVITISIPEYFGSMNYQILDMTGRHAGQGVIEPGSSSISATRLQGGMYAIYLFNAGSNHQVAVICFAVCR